MAESESSTNEKPWRFKAGNRGGPGNPHVKKVASLRKALFEALTPEELTKTIANLQRLSKGKSSLAVQAAKVLLSYGVGQPTAQVEISGPGGGPLEVVSGEKAIARLRAVLAERADLARAKAEGREPDGGAGE